MCLIMVAWRKHPAYPLVVAANRDEFHARPAAAATFWKDLPAILAGRDLQAKGTWLGVSRSGRFASVTNYRGAHDPKAAESRGALVTRFLLGNEAPDQFIRRIALQDYSGFNLLLADRDQLWWVSNRGNGPKQLEPGYYALGNLLLDSPEVANVRARFESTPASMEPLFTLLATAKIIAPVYGTRCSSVVLRDTDGRLQFAERPFGADGSAGQTARFELETTASYA